VYNSSEILITHTKEKSKVKKPCLPRPCADLQLINFIKRLTLCKKYPEIFIISEKIQITGVTRMIDKIRVLFICTANAARSQMAEGLMRAKYGDKFDVFSAGTRKTRVSSRAIQVMQEIGIDISNQRSKSLDELADTTFDVAVTLCDRAHQIYPVVTCAKKTLHCGFPDPHLTPGGDEEVLAGYRNVRDMISVWIETTFGTATKY
jgi:arsenate reductase